MSMTPLPSSDAPCEVKNGTVATELILLDQEAYLTKTINGEITGIMHPMTHYNVKDVVTSDPAINPDVYRNDDIDGLKELRYLQYEGCEDDIDRKMEKDITQIMRTYKVNRMSKVVLTASNVGVSTDRIVSLMGTLTDMGVREQDIEIRLRQAVGEDSDNILKLHVEDNI